MRILRGDDSADACNAAETRSAAVIVESECDDIASNSVLNACGFILGGNGYSLKLGNI